MATRNSKVNSLFCGLVLTIFLWLPLLPLFFPEFNGYRAFYDVSFQVSLGPRIPGTPSHARLINYITDTLLQSDWKVTAIRSVWNGTHVTNLLAYRGIPTVAPMVLLGAHFDTRPIADMDKGPSTQTPVPGANDGASGVAILLEIARLLPKSIEDVWLVFFDAEDGAGIDGQEGIIGSRAFMEYLSLQPQSVVIVDMVGDTDLNIFMEFNSDRQLSNEIWTTALELGYMQFIPIVKYAIIDDHLPFIDRGIPAVDIIDFDYEYWHTSLDTLDKVSPFSLRAVGETLRLWILKKSIK